MGQFAKVLSPESFALEKSRGSEDQDTRIFMRLSVILSDVLVLCPAILLAVSLSTARQQGTASIIRVLQLSLPVLLCPGLLLIDHGHFQYNGVSLGLALGGAVLCAHWGDLAYMQQRADQRTGLFSCGGLSAVWAGCALFAAALCYKQMELYHAPAFFFFLIGAALDAVASTRHALTRSRAACSARFWLLIAVFGSAVLSVMGASFAPFCLWADKQHWQSGTAMDQDGTAPHDGGLDPSKVTVARGSDTGECWGGVQQVLYRVFPFQRGLFEDKVANLWCVAEPFIRLRGSVKAGEVSLQSILGAATLLTLLLLVPVGVYGLRCSIFLGASTGYGTKGSVEPVSAGKQSVAAAGRYTGGTNEATDKSSTSTITNTSSSSLRRMLLLMEISALAFFLASFQVHEKSILIAMAPASGLCAGWGRAGGGQGGGTGKHKHWSHSWLVWVGTCTMVPLLLRDGLGWPTLVLLLAWFVVYGWEWVRGWGRGCSGVCSGTLAGLLGGLVACGAALGSSGLLLAIGAHVAVAPPEAMPDLFVLGIAAAGCGCLIVAYVAAVLELSDTHATTKGS